MTRIKVSTEVREMISEKYGIPFEQITDSTLMLDILDSLDRLNLLLDVKARYKFEINSEDIVRLKTIGDLVDVIVQNGNYF